MNSSSSGHSSNTGVLRQPFISTEAHIMGSRDRGYVDPVMRTRLDDSRAAGYEQGFADGARAAETGARRAAEAAQHRLQKAAETARAELAATNVQLVPELLDLAITIARHIVDEVPDQVRATLLDRIADALSQLDDDHLTVRVGPADLGEITAGVKGTNDVSVVPDPELGPGEARIEGTWCRADLTLPTAWGIVEESLRA